MADVMTLRPGTQVRVVQTIQRRDGPWETSVEGEVVIPEVAPTGSWFAHAPKGKLLLARLTLRKKDGERVRLVLDARTRVIVRKAAGRGDTAGTHAD